VDEVGQAMASGITEFFTLSESMDLMSRLFDAGVSPRPVRTEPTGGVLSGLTVALTGTLPTLTRSEAGKLIETYGGKIASGISIKTSLLLAGEAAGNKLSKARSLGVRVIDEAEFIRMLGRTE